MRFLSDTELTRLRPAERASTALPLPTQVISNGEYSPLPQSEVQRRAEFAIESRVGRLAPQHGMSRRDFLASSAGMAAAFLGMNEIFGPLFSVSEAEAATPGVADERSRALAPQLIIDCQTTRARRCNRPMLRPLRSLPNSTKPGARRPGQPPRFKFELVRITSTATRRLR
jgi:hypothetical protein